jgi:hypothetical protein
LSRPFGAGFGIGTVWAVEAVAALSSDAATNAASAPFVPRVVADRAKRKFECLFNAQS